MVSSAKKAIQMQTIILRKILLSKWSMRQVLLQMVVSEGIMMQNGLIQQRDGGRNRYVLLAASRRFFDLSTITAVGVKNFFPVTEDAQPSQ